MTTKKSTNQRRNDRGKAERHEAGRGGATWAEYHPTRGALLDAILAIPDIDRAAIVTTARLMRLASTETPGSVTRELVRALRDTPALRTDPAHLGLILRGMAAAFDGVGQGTQA